MPANVRQLHGNRHKPAAEGVQAVVAEPERPSSLRGVALAEWKRVVPELTRLRLLSRLDRGLLLNYCKAIAFWSGLRDGHKAARFYRSDILPLAKELGLTPNARLRMRAPEPDEDDSEDLDA